MHFPRLASTVTLLLAAAACSDSNDSPTTTTNPNQPTGSAGSGGSANSGGAGAGGSAAAPGGSSGSGGSSSETNPNPTLNQGGGNGNGSASAGAAGTPGAAGAAPVAVGDAGAQPPRGDGLTFFVTSRGLSDGGNLGGLAGADAFCTTLATAADPALASKTWHAYLSTTAVNARDRIGAGPWRNAAGEIIANNVADLHDQAAGGALDATWPVNDFSVPVDETGAQVPQNVHDVLTGSQQDGTLAAGQTCNDWTSNSATATAQIGHLNRAGLNGQPPSWNSVHTVGCGAIAAAQNGAPGTVSSGGGRGSLYCFAAD